MIVNIERNVKDEPPVFYANRDQVILGFALLVVFLFFVLFAGGIFASHYGITLRNEAVLEIFATTAISLGAMGLISWLTEDTEKSMIPRGMKITCFYVIIALLIISAITAFTDYIVATGRVLLNDGIDQIKSSHGADLIMFSVAISILSPLSEELIFRRLLYNALRKSLGFISASAICSLMFALFHLSLGMFVPLFMVSFVLSWLYQKTGRIGASFASHAIVNGITLLFVLLRAHRL